MKKVRQWFVENPIICAVKDEKELDRALDTESKLIFLLFGDITNIERLGEKVISKDKVPFFHMDMIQGLNQNPVVLDFIKDKFKNRCGIISTRINLIQKASDINMANVYRMFILDSMAVRNELNLLGRMKSKPDAIEIMPGVIPKVIKKFSEETEGITIVAGGLIEEKAEVMLALKNGATCVSTSQGEIWE